MSESQSLPLTGAHAAVAIEGAVSLEETAPGLHPWRLPVAQRDLFEPSVANKASMPAGVRLCFTSDTSSVTLDLAPAGVEPDPPWVYDLLVDGQLHQRLHPAPDTETVAFTGLPDGEHEIELWLPSQYAPVVIRALRIDAGATARPLPDERRRAVFYGSSISHCRHAAGPTETWPAIVARNCGLHLTSLGYGGDCHMDPIVGRMIRDLPADVIGLKLGINMTSGSASDRLFRSLAIGLIQTIRDGHPDTPMAVVSPIFQLERETTPNVVGMTLVRMRERLAEAVDLLRGHGDTNLHYVDGLSLMGADDVHLYVDGVHPSADGYRFLADAYTRQVMPRLGFAGAGHGDPGTGGSHE